MCQSKSAISYVSEVTKIKQAHKKQILENKMFNWTACFDMQLAWHNYLGPGKFSTMFLRSDFSIFMYQLQGKIVTNSYFKF